MTDDDRNNIVIGGVTADQLRSVIERIERLEEDRKEIADQIREVYAEAKGTGFDPAILRKVIAIRRKSAEDRETEAAILDTYLTALGLRAGRL